MTDAAPAHTITPNESELQVTTDRLSARRSAAGCSVVVLTLNEEINIGACLQSLADFEDVHVLDSGSTDRTVEIARTHAAQVAHNKFQSFGEQRNWAHDCMPLRNDWVLHLDADERMTPALRAEVEIEIAQDRGALAGHFIAERTLLQGRWLRYAGQYPRYQARLVNRARMRFIDHGHGQREQSTLPFGRFRQPYDHHAFSHGMERWLQKHAGYAMREAQAAQAEVTPMHRLLTAAWSGGALERRRALKSLAARVPMRPQLRWLYVLFVCGGLLDGRAGWQYARMMKVFQDMIDLCAQEHRAPEGIAAARVHPMAAQSLNMPSERTP